MRAGRGADASPGRHALRAGADECTKHAQARLLGQGGECDSGRLLVHDSQSMDAASVTPALFIPDLAWTLGVCNWSLMC